MVFFLLGLRRHVNAMAISKVIINAVIRLVKCFCDMVCTRDSAKQLLMQMKCLCFQAVTYFSFLLPAIPFSAHSLPLPVAAQSSFCSAVARWSWLEEGSAGSNTSLPSPDSCGLDGSSVLFSIFGNLIFSFQSRSSESSHTVTQKGQQQLCCWPAVPALLRVLGLWTRFVFHRLLWAAPYWCWRWIRACLGYPGLPFSLLKLGKCWCQVPWAEEAAARDASCRNTGKGQRGARGWCPASVPDRTAQVGSAYCSQLLTTGMWGLIELPWGQLCCELCGWKIFSEPNGALVRLKGRRCPSGIREPDSFIHLWQPNL